MLNGIQNALSHLEAGVLQSDFCQCKYDHYGFGAIYEFIFLLYYF